VNSEPHLRTTRSLAQRAVSDIALVLGLTAFLPFLFHVLPTWDDTPWGARLLPIFYAPLVAAFTGRLGLGLGIAVLAPWANHFLLGMPVFGVAVLLTLELVLFCIILNRLLRYLPPAVWMAPAAYLLTKPFSATLLLFWPLIPAPPLAFVTQSVLTAWPGMILLALLAFICKHHPTPR
jgi:hypothetical protein